MLFSLMANKQLWLQNEYDFFLIWPNTIFSDYTNTLIKKKQPQTKQKQHNI